MNGPTHLRPEGEALLRIDDLHVVHRIGRAGRLHAVSGVSFDVLPGETVGIVGESGCGKSSTGRAIMQLPPPTSGSVMFDGVDLTGLNPAQLRHQRTRLQMIFQDPRSSLNPRRRIRDVVAEPVTIWGESKSAGLDRVAESLAEVGLDIDLVGDRYPHEFSGGQAQRIGIARALMMNPRLIICDEPVSALDVSVQAAILNLLEDLRERHGLTMVFISHDLGVIKSVSDRVIVMYLGKICEVAETDAFFAAPSHPYSAALLAAVPGRTTDAVRRRQVMGETPSPMNPPSGCRFRTRCPLATELCAREEPQLREVAPGSFAACHFPRTETEPLGSVRVGAEETST